MYYAYESTINDASGTTTWTTAVKKVSYQGILTPVGADASDDTGGRGFFLWTEKGGDDDGTSYSFTKSYDFLLSLPPEEPEE